MREVRAVKLARLGGHAARQIGKADNADVMLHRNHTRIGEFTIPALFSSQIDDNRARFHRFDHVRGDQFRRRSAGNKCRGDDDVDVFGLFGEQFHLGLDELFAHHLGISASAGAVFLEFHLQEFGPHTFDLLLDLQPCVEGAHDRAHAARGANGRQPRNTGTDNHHFRRRHLARRRDLTGKEAPEIIRGFNHGTIPADIRHRRPRIEFLCPADPRH